MFARIAKLIVLLLIAVGIGSLSGFCVHDESRADLAAADHVADLPRRTEP